MINNLEMYAPVGMTYVVLPVLQFKTHLWISRSGNIFTVITSGTPTSSEAKYDINTGRIDFLNPFGGDIFGSRSMQEFLHILYKP